VVDDQQQGMASPLKGIKFFRDRYVELTLIGVFVVETTQLASQGEIL
jgi:hypothetical protein